MIQDLPALLQTKRFLGREFLTWLVYRAEETGGRFDAPDGPVEVHLGDRLVLAGADDDRARLTIVGAGDVRAEIGAGLRRGRVIDRARFTIRRGDRQWELTLDGGVLDVGALRCPPLGERDRGVHADPRAAFENDLFLRLADIEEALGVLDALFAEFARLRVSETWSREIVPALRGWAEGLA